MNFINMVIRKPYSAGAICFFWMPLGCGVLVLLVLGILYWYITLGAFVLVCMVAGTQRDNHNEMVENFRAAFYTESARRNNELIWMIEHVGKPGCNGKFSAAQTELWDQYKQKDTEYQVWWKQMSGKLIELEGYQTSDEELEAHFKN